jgi:hypothetical protein
VDKARASCLAAKSSSTTPVFTYTVPEESGLEKIHVFLHDDAAQWTPAGSYAELSEYGRPDAIIAPHAGLGSYVAWHPVVMWTHATETPFGATEYAEQSCETQQTILKAMVQRQVMMSGSICSGPGVPMGEDARRSLMKGRSYLIEVNPFQKPGQRPVQTKLPNVPNGFTI